MYPRLLNEDKVITEYEAFVKKGVTPSFFLDVPEESDGGNSGRLRITGKFDDEDGVYVINKTKDINLRKQDIIIFLQTDKPIYKPGQTVKFRVLPVLSTCLKSIGNKEQGQIWIDDPENIRVAQWLNVSFVDGIVQLELPLPKEPVLGHWKVKVRVGQVFRYLDFEVAEYVLPKFKVSIVPPSYLLANVETISWKVCAEYTYGQPVAGTLKITVSYLRYHWEKEPPTFIDHETQIAGCYNYSVNASALEFYKNRYAYRGLQLTAQVIEKGTGIDANATNVIYRTFYPLSFVYLEESQGEQFFKPGLPFHGTLKVQNPDQTVAAGEQVRICSYAELERWTSNRWIDERIKNCKDFLSDEDGIIRFTISPQGQETIRLRIEVTATAYAREENDDERPSLRQPSRTIHVRSWYSPTGSHIQIEPSKVDIECGVPYDAKVLYTFKEDQNITFHYQVMVQGRIITQGHHTKESLVENDQNSVTDDTYLPQDSSAICLKLKNNQTWGNLITVPPYVGQASIPFTPQPSMAPIARLLVYYVREDGETVADSVEFAVKKCLKNKVGLEFQKTTVSPGSSTAIKLTASPLSLCGVGAVDKSVHLLKKDKQLSEEQIFSTLKSYDISGYHYPRQTTSGYTYCQNIGKNKGETVGERRLSGSYQKLSPSEYVDAIQAFEEAGLVVISDLTLETRPCKPGEYYQRSNNNLCAPVALDGAAQDQTKEPVSTTEFQREDGTSKQEPDLEIRSFFPETWIWNLETVGESGELNIKQDIPHTITEWVGSAVCLNEEAGLGISGPVTVKAFQPFFVSFTLPYSVIRGEKVPVIVTVFNYLSECLPIELQLEYSEAFEVKNDTSVSRICVCGQSSDTIRWLVEPHAIGKVNLTVYAHALKDTDVCGNEISAQLDAKDAVKRELLVEAEGILTEETQNSFVCVQDYPNRIFMTEYELLLSDNAVNDSGRAHVTVTGDIMSSIIDSLSRLIRLPTGCGEQNMVKFVPNIFVLQYLTVTGNLKKDVQDKLLENLKTGYLQELKYRHSDFSYSVFGEKDPVGSLWLTAFVVKSFSHASQYIFVDENNIKLGISWIVRKQQQNGCFPRVGKLLNSAMQGGLQTDDATPAPLTSYVLISLLEAGYQNDTVIKAGLQCLEAKSDPSMYSKALFSYAAALAGSPLAQGFVTDLEGRAIKEDSKMYWRKEDTKLSQSTLVELASYVLLTYLKLGGTENFKKASSLVQWLMDNRNPYGGFFSTQDTVIALQALSQYAALISREKVVLTVTLKGDNLQDTFLVDETNKLVQQSTYVSTIPNLLEVEATGSGCVFIQAILRYNIPPSKTSKDFQLAVQSNKIDSFGRSINITSCVRYTGKGKESNMAILEIKMLSGYEVDEPFLQELVRSGSISSLKRVETEAKQANFYFSELTNEVTCLRFLAHQTIPVENIQPATARVYDYYEKEKSVEDTYTIGECLEE
ncbi:alpha-2-macroglobulin-like protein 1 [Tachypleus tridentatus]|uniref:alpha-2-macroglobulin-like protein 1 n=1 Tax=Tachypleus tridentatus TaxID=6853 RepID=UPI003FD4DFC6